MHVVEIKEKYIDEKRYDILAEGLQELLFSATGIRHKVKCRITDDNYLKISCEEKND
jgi:hypothetical protein